MSIENVREGALSPEVMVHMAEVTKCFGKVVALRGINLSVKRGHYLGIFGPNGAGKTTLLRIIATLTRPSSGTVTIAGHDAVREAEKIRPLIGVLNHRTFLYGHLTAFENLQFYGRMFRMKHLSARIREMLRAVDLEAQARHLVRTYSRGMQQRLAIARAILHHPKLLLLDEPYTGLDQRAAMHLQELLQQLRAADCTMLVSTHNLQRGLALCDEILIQCRGQVMHRCSSTGLDLQMLEQMYSQYAE